MRKVYGLLFAVLSLSILAGCGAIPGNTQVNAGINKAEIVFNDDGRPKSALIIGGKENENITLNVTTPDGLIVEYAATGSKAFDGQKVRGAVEQAISSDIKETVPGIVDSITDTLKKVLE